MSYRDVDVNRLLLSFARAKLEIDQLHDLDAANVMRIRELEEVNARLVADNALLRSTVQNDIDTVVMQKPAEELIPDDESPPAPRIIRSRSKPGDNSPLFIGA